MPRANRLEKGVEELMARKTRLLSKAQALSDMEMEETAAPAWSAPAVLEERIAPLLEALGRGDEAALHRVSGASCFEKVGEWARAANLFRAALSGPLRDAVRSEVESMLTTCLSHLTVDDAQLFA